MDPHLTDDQFEAILSNTEAVDGEPNGELESISAIRSHLAECEDCRTRMKAHQAAMIALAELRLDLPDAVGPECPPEEVWIEVSIGISNDETERYLDHAAKCDHCGPLMKSVANAVSPDSSPEEDSFIRGLASSNAGWQQRMARTLSAGADKNSGRRTRPGWTKLIFWPRLAFASVALVLLAASAWFTYRLRQPKSAAELLAEAYTEQGTLDARIPGGKFSHKDIHRAESQSNFEKSPSLLRAEIMISEAQQSNPSDPGLLDLRGRAELVEGNYKAAIGTLQQGLLYDPDSFSLLSDLGAAYYTGRDYGNAIEVLGKALSKRPDDPIALYNRALACEELSLFSQAETDWNHFLSVEKDNDWKAQAREHLEKIRKTTGKHSALIPLLGPREFTALVSSASRESQSALNSRAERYLELAFRSWLADALQQQFSQSSEESLGAVKALSRMLLESHGDPWLRDLLSEGLTSGNVGAIRDVLASDAALLAGHDGQALEFAERSARQFADARNSPGVFWARLAAMRAQDSALDFSGCLEDEDGELAQLAASNYYWLRASTLIEQGECLFGVARLGDAISKNREGRKIAQMHDFPALELRAIAFGSNYWFSTGDQEEGLRQLRYGLETFWKSDIPDAPGENLYASMIHPSEAFEWPFIDACSLEELLRSFPSKDPVDQAVELELLGDAQMRAGNLRLARATLSKAANVLNAVTTDPAVSLRRAHVALKDAEILLRLGDSDRSISRLLEFRSEFEAGSPGRYQAEFFKTLGEAYLSRGDESEAEPLLERSVAVRETGLENLSGEAEKLAWSRARSGVYRDLLEIRLHRGKISEAFAWWESYKGSSLRGSVDASPAEDQDRVIQALTRSDSALSAQESVLISYAPLRKSIAVFVVRQGVVRLHILPLDPNLDDSSKRFLLLCADPSSNLGFIDHESRRIYQLLVEPIEADLRGATSVRIETDGAIDRVPFDLLRAADGSYLGDRARLTYSQGLLFDRPSQSSTRGFTPDSTALIIASPGGYSSSSPTLPGVNQEAADVASHFNHPIFFSGQEILRRDILERLRTAEVFHFAGHGLVSGNRVGLVLGADSILSARDVADLQLRNLKLAVLSSCASANGNQGTGSDIDSVARTLLTSGVPQVVASRWSVDSEVTRQWMSLFYSKLMAGKSPEEAVQTASAGIRADPKLRHPYYWASFATFGNSSL